MVAMRLVRGLILLALAAASGCATRGPTPPPQSSPGSELLEGPGFPSSMAFFPVYAETGTTLLAVCAGPNGRLTRVPAIVKSSGSSNLDSTALVLTAAATFGHWVVRRRDGGAPGTACAKVAVHFTALPQPGSTRARENVSIKVQATPNGDRVTGG